MKKLSIILILSTFLFSTVTNNGATLTIDSGVSVYVNGELVNDKLLTENQTLKFC